jgi:DNA-binding NtrC family response regulator
MRVLSAFHWPGNIRQLENAVFRAVVLAESDTVGVDEFPQVAAQVGNQAGSQLGDATGVWNDDAAAGTAEEFSPLLVPVALDDEARTAPAVVPALPAGDALPLLDVSGEVRPLDEFEADIIRYAISHYRGQMSEVARRLKIGRSTLYRKLEALGLDAGRAEAE